MDVLINVVNQRLKMSTNYKNLISGSQEFIRFVFNLSWDWNDVVAFAQFTQNGVSYNKYLDEENSVYLPQEIVTGECTLTLYGTSGYSTIGTTNYLTLTIKDNNYNEDGNSSEISTPLYNQLVSKYQILAEKVDAETKRHDLIVSIKEGSTTGDAEIIDARIGSDGTEYDNLGTAIRSQVANVKEFAIAECAQVPNKAVLSGSNIKFYRSTEETDSYLFELDVTTLLESGLSLENLSMSTEKNRDSITLVLSDGETDRSIDLPVPVDDVLSSSSTNPVQNRVVTEQINYIIEEIENIKENGIGGGEGVVIRLTNQNGTATLVGSYGNSLSLMFTFTSTDNELPTGNANCKITVNSVQKVNMSIPQGLTSIDIAPYLNIGSNTVVVTCTDIYGKSRSLSYDVTIVKLNIESTFNASVTYENDILFKYTPYGSVEKTIHFVIDGSQIGTVITSLSGKQMTRTIPKMSHGTHRLEVYSTATLNEVELESPRLVYDIMCVEAGDTTAMISSVYTEESVTQGEQVSIPFIVYDPTKLSCDITLDIYTKENGSEISFLSQEITVDRKQQSWNTRKYPIGEVYFRIKYGDIYKQHKITVTESSLKVEPEINDLELYLSSEGRSNNETTPGQWVYGNITTTFDNMNWNSVGWINDENGDACLRLNGDATATINFKPFAEDIRTYGKTIELIFAIRDVNNREAIPISCMNGDIGFEVKADTAYIRSEQSEVFCNYKEEERVHLAFVVESKDEYRMLSVYLNGVMSDAIQYPATDNFQQSVPVNISIGSPYCGVDLYMVRSYSTALTDSSLATNYIADISDIVRKTEAYEDNDIYDEFGAISFSKAKEKNSVMVIVGDLPTYKGDKKTCKIIYHDVEDSNLDWEETGVGIDVQGTSSQWYVRKNWKLKTPNEHYIDVDQLPGKVICIKVDYAEATGTHNTQNAVFVEKLYSEKIPPQETNPKVRTTIYGKPILLFHQSADGVEPTFYGKANYNWDKGAENVFGFTSDYDVECWEFKNNTSEACLFTGEIPNKWDEDFEARYPDGYENISRFKIMHDWVVSTRQNAATGNVLSSTYTDADGNTYTHDTKEYRLAKFKTEFENYFDMHYSLIYYVYTFFALMTDQRAKNMFLTYWGNTGKWYPYFYDNDTSFGINNEGGLVFDYYHEDTDQLDGANVYNGQLSTLWTNFRMAFPNEIQETYQDLRSNSVLNYDELVDQFITKGSDKWSESVYNEDGDFKYVSMLRSSNDATNLPQVRGTGEEHFRYFVENRLNYCDSKWYAGEYISRPNPDSPGESIDNFAVLRIYTPVDEEGNPRTDLVIPASADITLTLYSHMYAGVRYKANGSLMQQRLSANETYTFEAPNEIFNDTETAIYGAPHLSSLGDLAPLYLGYIDVGAATKLVELKIGDATPGYQNDNLYHLALGTNRLLKKIDIQNCTGFNQALVLTGCPNIEEVYAKGSSITGVELPDSGYLKILQLPSTITNLTLKNQFYIEDLTIEGLDRLKTLTIENTPVDTLGILSNAVNVERVRLTDVDWHYDDASILYELINRDIGGIDENGTNTDTMWIDGKCHIEYLTGEEFAEIKRLYPYLDITYTTLESQLIYMSEDGTTELHRETILNGGNGTDPVTNGTIPTPTKESTAQYDFTFGGWSLKSGGDANDNALKAVEADRTVYVSFSKSIRSYTVRFINGSKVEETKTVEYGSDAVYTGETPTKNDVDNPEDFEFIGWKPEPTNIQGDTDCYAQYYDTREITDDWATIEAACLDGTATEKYAIGSYKPVDIIKTSFPYEFRNGASVVYEDEIHILGSELSKTSHYKFNGTEWVEVSTIPYEFYRGGSVVFNDGIHIFGGTSKSKKHYIWTPADGWSESVELPCHFIQGSAVVFNNQIHILGGSFNTTSHYAFDGTEWSEISTLPYELITGSAIVLNGEIHILGSGKATTSHYKWDGFNWSEVSQIPFSTTRGSSVVYNNEIHLLGSGTNDHTTKYHYKWNEHDGWISVSKLPYNFYEGSSVVYENAIHIIGSQSTYFHKSHYKYDGIEWAPFGDYEIINMEVIAHNHDELVDSINKWESVDTLPDSSYMNATVVLNNEVYIFNSNYKLYKYNGVNYTLLSDLEAYPIRETLVVYNNEIHFLKGTTHYKWNGTELVTVSTLPVDSTGSTVCVYNNEMHWFGNIDSNYRTMHYIWSDEEAQWFSADTTSPSHYSAIAIVYNDKLHTFSEASHRIYDGNSWINLSNTPFATTNGSVVIWDGCLYVIGGSSKNRAFYKWDGENLSEVGLLPYGFSVGGAIIYNNEIHIFGGDGVVNRTKHWRYAGTGWEKCENINATGIDSIRWPVKMNGINYICTLTGLYEIEGTTLTEIHTSSNQLFNTNGAIFKVYNNELYATDREAGSAYGNFYKYNGNGWDLDTGWDLICSIPATPGTSMIEYNGLLYMLTEDKTHSAMSQTCYTFDGTSWVYSSTLPYGINGYGCLVIYQGLLYYLVGKNMCEYDYNNNEWTIVRTDVPFGCYDACAIEYNNCLFVMQAERYSIFDGEKWKQYSMISAKIVYLGVNASMRPFIEKGRLRIWGNYFGGNVMYRNPRATLTFFAKEAMGEPVQTGTHTNGYLGTNLKIYVDNVFENLNDDVKNVIKPVHKYIAFNPSDLSIVSIEEKCWLASANEVGFTVGDKYPNGEGVPYGVFTDNASRIRSNSYWWTRSMNFLGNNPVYYWTEVTKVGTLGSGSKDDKNVHIVFGFCI